MSLKCKILKGFLLLIALFFISLIAFLIWMQTGEEEPLDYSSMAVNLGPLNPKLNGYTHLRQISEKYDANFPEEFGWDIDHSKRENWDEVIFSDLLEDNQKFLNGIEEAFEREVFMQDQLMNPETVAISIIQMRSYTELRLYEARLLQLQNNDALAFERLMDLQSELERFDQSAPGAVIGWLTSIAMIGMLESEIEEFLSEAVLPAETWKRAARDYTIYLGYPKSLRQAYQLEFQLFRSAVSEMKAQPRMGFGYTGLSEPSLMDQAFYFCATKLALKPQRTSNEMFRLYSPVVEHAKSTIQQRDAILSSPLKERHEDTSLLRYLSRNALGDEILRYLYPAMIDRILEIADRCAVRSRSTQLMFALKAYYSEQQQLPDTLEELTPGIIPEIPKDPFDGKPMRYSKERRIVYSVGNDFIDAGGSKLPFIHTTDDDIDCAEYDISEPTFPIRFMTGP